MPPAVDPAQPPMKHGAGMGPGSQYLRLFDPATIQTIEGEITKIDRVAHRGGRMTGVHATVKTPGGNVVVHLGPSWFIDNQDFRFNC